MIPKILYKYVDAETASLILSSKSIKYSPATWTNDPFEMSWDFTKDVMEYISLNKTVGEIFVPPDIPQQGLLSRDQIQESFKDINDKESILAFLGQVQVTLHHRYFFDDIGVLCLARSPDVPQMWAHYASQRGLNFSGYCLGFATSASCLNLKNTYDLSGPCPIKYKLRRPRISSLNDARSFKKVLTTKHKHWGYEQEFRAFCNTGKGAKGKIVNFNAGDLLEVHCGFGGVPPSSTKIINLIQQDFPCARLFFTLPSIKTYRIESIPIDDSSDIARWLKRVQGLSNRFSP